MISVNGLSVGFGGTNLYENVSFLISNKDRIGLAGKNGSGKSTLLKILAGIKKSYEGKVSIPKGCTIGYLPQDMVHNLGKTVFDETATAFDEIKKLERRIDEITHLLETRTDYESDEYMDLITELNEVNDRYVVMGASSMEGDIEQTLIGLGFEQKDFTRMTDEFSGGWRMRIELAKILLQKPNVLLLDEPTNHLDIESIQWLESLLKNYYGAIVMVSHDKVFLDATTIRTIEISSGKIYDYKANYSKYVQLRKERREQQAAAAKNQQKFIEKTEQLINKFRAKASKASFAQSLIKKLDKLEIIEIDDEDTKSVKFNFPTATRSGIVVVEAAGLKKSYDKNTIFSDVDYIIERQEKIAFVGRNGEGKSTMVRLIAGQEEFEGKLNIGINVNIGYYAQNQTESLDVNKTVLNTVEEEATEGSAIHLRTFLGSFLFRGDDVEKKVSVLSGGEKARLAMCKLLLQPYNFFVLDEPTNHLDMRSKEVLKKALMEYNGTLIIVSHDRDFLQGLTNKVFEFSGGKVKQHIGDISEYISSRKIEHLSKLDVKEKIRSEQTIGKTDSVYVEKKKQEKERKQLQNRISKVENVIERLENEIKLTDKKLADPLQYLNIINDKSALAKYDEAKKQLDIEMQRWQDLQGLLI